MDKPQTLSTAVAFEGSIFDIRVDEIREGEVEYKRDIVVHKGSAVIVPIYNDNTVGLVRQYRHAAGKFLLEVPAGSLEAGEDPELGAIRELEEELGVVAANIEKISEFYVSPGFLTEKMFVYLATGLTETAQRLDGDEIIEIERVPLDTAIAMTRDGRIEDAKSIIGLTMAAIRLSRQL